MSITTTYRDNELTQRREAWQNGKLAYHWPRQDIDAMHTEAPETVWAWGDVPHWKRKRALSSNEK